MISSRFPVSFIAAAIISFISALNAQTAVPFQVSLEEISISGMPGVQSFVHAQDNDKWLIIGGRTDGLHQRQPFASFASADNNTMAYVVDPVSNQVWSEALSSLPTAMYEQLQSTNMEFEQRDSVLYIIGGYGYSASAGDHITHDKLTAVNVPGLVNAIINNTSITSHFRQISHTGMEVTGGYLGIIGQKFYLAGGQEFTGRYNPHGPNHGPGFVQNYTNAIRVFEISDNGQTLAIQNYSEWLDTANLHRRDYNMAYQVFPDGTAGFTMFSGVFQYSGDIPWLNTVDFNDTGYVVRNGFNQYLNQYHTAHMPVYDASGNAMHTIFFGGMSRYTLDASGNLVDDINVPFVKTISQVSRYHDGSMQEFKIGEMPGLLGSGAEFIPVSSQSFVDTNGMVLLDPLSNQKTLVGYVIGGIESTAANIFFSNTGTQSNATSRVFKVFITKNAIGNKELMDGEEFFKTSIYPNPAHDIINLHLQIPHNADIDVDLLDESGKKVLHVFKGVVYSSKKLDFDLSELSHGVYFLRISSGDFVKNLSVVKE
jgi:hypothetical protein